MSAKDLREANRDLYATVRVIPTTINHILTNHSMSEDSSTVEFIDELIDSMKYFEEQLLYYRKKIEEKKKAFIDSFEAIDKQSEV